MNQCFRIYRNHCSNLFLIVIQLENLRIWFGVIFLVEQYILMSYNTSTEKSPKTVPRQCARIGMNWTFKVLCLPTKPSQVAHLLSMEGTFNWETTSNMSWHFSWNVLVSNVCQHVRGVMVFEKLQKTHWCKNLEIFLQFRKGAYTRYLFSWFRISPGVPRCPCSPSPCLTYLQPSEQGCRWTHRLSRRWDTGPVWNLEAICSNLAQGWVGKEKCVTKLRLRTDAFEVLMIWELMILYRATPKETEGPIPARNLILFLEEDGSRDLSL